MRIERIWINNFKGLVRENFDPSRFSCLVGENNAGKSSVLQALVYALNRPTQLPAALYYDVTCPVEFKIEFSGITDEHLLRLVPEHREKLTSLLQDGCLTLVTRYRSGEKVELMMLRPTPLDRRFTQEAIDAALSGKRNAAIRAAAMEHCPELAEGMPEGLSMTDTKVYLARRVAELPPAAFEMVEGPLPSGIPSSINALLPEPIYIAAVKNFGDELKTTQSTSFGRLLGLLLEDMTPDLAEVDRALETLRNMLNRQVVNGRIEDRRHPGVQQLEATVESLLRENFPQARVELEVPPPELRAVLGSAQIYVDDGSRDLIENKGDGIKRSLTFALLQAYVQTLERRARSDAEEVPAARPLLFLFEEPELYLHPKSQRVLFATLGRIADAHQVVVTTHSPLFFSPGVTASFVRVAKSARIPKPEGRLYPVNFELDPVNAETFRLARYENADAAFFSSRVVLFEGESGDYYCKHIATKLDQEWDFDKRNIALVRVSGKGNFSKFRAFFESFGIEVKIVADLDALFDGFEHLGASLAVSNLRNELIQRIDARIAATGIKPELSGAQVRSRVTQGRWRGLYETAREGLRRMQETGVVEQAALASVDALFTWEQDVARLRAVQDDQECRDLLIPVADALRAEGICLLTQGAIEDYYPTGAPASGPKPQRALRAAELVEGRPAALALSRSLGVNRPTELEEVFGEIFG
ncbi:AAA family ATPase [Ralstonia chuxiongensis]|uniref:AAA family ATPase n=1 Tax=Ralstonia chuxiongensis TaxID=2957504 RepID=UPI0028F4DCE1|nr:AAA family ATPase [Ralstonia chuxiongensis]CAJ0784805.1 hypothetical protein R8510_05304 [Ralstonia chuxiongensis]